MKTEEYNKGVSFRVPYVGYGHLCRAISEVPGVVFAKKRRFFWSGGSAEFVFKDHAFEMETDQWDGALWVIAKDRRKHETDMADLRNAVKRFPTAGGRLAGIFRGIISKTFT